LPVNYLSVLNDGSATKLGEAFDTWCAGLFSLPLPLPWTGFGKALRCREELLEWPLKTIIVERQKMMTPGQDALAIVLQAKDEKGQSLSLAELKDQVLLLLFAGH
jgi:cytochrome P450